MIGEYARVSAAAGGFDRSDAQLRRALLRLDARGFAQLSKACDKLLEQAEKIEASAAERIARDPHADDVVEVGIGLLLFEAVRLSGREDGDKPATRRRPRAGVSSRRRLTRQIWLRHADERAGCPGPVIVVGFDDERG